MRSTTPANRLHQTRRPGWLPAPATAGHERNLAGALLGLARKRVAGGPHVAATTLLLSQLHEVLDLCARELLFKSKRRHAREAGDRWERGRQGRIYATAGGILNR